MSAPDPQQMRELASDFWLPVEHEQRVAEALRAAADQLEATQDRERIERAVGSVLFDASNYPAAVSPHLLGQDIGPLRTKVTDAVLFALTADPEPRESDATYSGTLCEAIFECAAVFPGDPLAPVMRCRKRKGHSGDHNADGIRWLR